jgi:3-hydroxyacyl-CoA dehydrogenase
MGSRIAAHLANAGIPVLLLDLVSDGKPLAKAALDALSKAKPAPFYEPSLAALITPGTFDDDLPKLADCDWVVEAIAEDLQLKTALLRRVVPHLSPRALLTTNTSGLPIGQLASGLDAAGGWSVARFFGAHFFNPPRQMRLLELIPAAQSDPALVAAFAAFADRNLGKQVVFAKDTPNFIANRLGIAAIFSAARLMIEQKLTIEEVDALTGPALGWPRSATFRLADLIGLDVLAHIAANFPQGLLQSDFSRILAQMLQRGWLGDKSGQGFYKKQRGEDGKDIRLVLDLDRFEYRPAQKPALPTLESARSAASLPERLRLLLAADPANDKTAAFLWPFLAALWADAASLIGAAAPDAASIDRAMRNGFNWELGPFELFDAAGLAATVSRLQALGLPVPAHAQALLAAGHTSWYARDSSTGASLCFQPASGKQEPIPVPSGHARIADFRRTHAVVCSNPGASLVDLGDGVGCIELHSVKNAIGGDVLALVASVLHPASDAVRDFAAFVIASDRENFSVGANLKQMLLAAQESQWQELAAIIGGFQRMTSAIKFCPRPVVVAPFGFALGGGAEICLHAARRQAHAETCIGLVEAGVGLIPGGGGTKELLLHAVDAAYALVPSGAPARFAQSAELAAALQRSFETIAQAKVSASAAGARSLGLLSPADRITMNRERLLLDAKAQAALLANSGYTPPQPRTQIPAPGASALAALETAIYQMGESGRASEHDQKIARWIAYILAGGRVTAGTPISEDYLLQLEREAFLSLCGEPKTQERIAHILKTGKPLRN